MRIDKCKTEFFIDDVELEKGDWLKSKGGNWHLVLDVLDSGYTQSTNGRSIQSFNQEKAKKRIGIFDGYYYNVRDIDDVCIMYTELYRPNKTEIEKELLENIKIIN